MALDPIEVKSVGDIFGSQLTCLGALKGNINHTESAAGLAGFIKLVKVVQQHTMFPHGAGLWRPDLSIELAPALMLSENCQALRADANAAGVNCFGFPAPTCMRGSCPCPRILLLRLCKSLMHRSFVGSQRVGTSDFVTAKV